MSDTVQGAPDSLAPSTGRSVCVLRVVHSPDAAAIGRQIELRRNHTLFVGREVPGGLSLVDERLSKQHFMVAAVRTDFECADVGSTNGTFVDGALLKSAKLAHGSVVRAGDTLFVVSFGDEARRLHDAAKRLAPTDIPVLLQGETGSGKEVLARALHEQSARRGAFVPVNCATLPRELIASELFGHAKNAFSGATQARVGLFRSADGGTLFLDVSIAALSRFTFDTFIPKAMLSATVICGKSA